MMQGNTKKILIGFRVDSKVSWHQTVDLIINGADKEVALLLAASSVDERRELYKLLEKREDLVIPYVEINSSFEAWELDYLSSTFSSSVFGLDISPAALSFIATMSKYTSNIALKNTIAKDSLNLFIDEALTRAGVAGVCLDAAILEHHRLYNQKVYQKEIHALDHHALKATHIKPFAPAWYKRWLTIKPERLTSLAELHYIKYVPGSYLANLIIIDSNNLPDEQIEIQTYLKNIIK